MGWTRIDITGGVVNTRDESSVGPPELISAQSIRLKPNDPVQLHKDRGRVSFGTPASGTTIVGLHYLSQETTSDRLLIVTNDGTDSYLETAVASTTGTFASIQTVENDRPYTGSGSMVATDSAVIHRGDQYFVGVWDSTSSIGEKLVVQDNVARYMSIAAAQTRTQGTVSSDDVNDGDGYYNDGDLSVYYVTEYDSVNDLEGIIIEAVAITMRPAGAETDFSFNFAYVGTDPTPANPHADSYRIYRHYVGNVDTDPTVITIADQLVAEARGTVGGLLDTISFTPAWPPVQITTIATEDDLPLIDPSTPYPVVSGETQLGPFTFQYFNETNNFSVGTLFQDSVVVNDEDEDAVLIRYSPPAGPEYQPTPYFMYFATPYSDDVVGLGQVNERLIALTESGVHRINYLPFEGNIEQLRGQVTEEITGLHGCVGRRAYTTTETEAGEFLVWLAREGIRATNGVGWVDFCPDWSVDGAGLSPTTLSTAVLINNPRDHRLELYVGSTRWDFYYHPSHLKNGRLKALGPNTVQDANGAAITVVDATVGRLSGKDQVWIASASTVYTEAQNFDSQTMEFETGHISAGPLHQLACNGVALTHTDTPTATAIPTTTTKEIDLTETEYVQESLSLQYNQTDKAMMRDCLGDPWLRVKMRSTDTLDMSWGPMWVNAHEEDDEGEG